MFAAFCLSFFKVTVLVKGWKSHLLSGLRYFKSKPLKNVSLHLWARLSEENLSIDMSINKQQSCFSASPDQWAQTGYFRQLLVCLQIESLLESHSWISLAGQSGKHGGMSPGPYAQKNFHGWRRSHFCQRADFLVCFSFPRKQINHSREQQTHSTHLLSVNNTDHFIEENKVCGTETTEKFNFYWGKQNPP